jgi:CspA family cold shock protein
MTQERFEGEVEWFNAKKGIGFIKPDAGEKDLFVHYSNIVVEEGKFKTLVSGQRVSYELGENHRGTQAVKVTVLE